VHLSRRRPGHALGPRKTLSRNRAVPPIQVDPHDGTVTLDGRVLGVDLVDDAPLGRKYVLG
jgi:urease alpha subunit